MSWHRFASLWALPIVVLGSAGTAHADANFDGQISTSVPILSPSLSFSFDCVAHNNGPDASDGALICEWDPALTEVSVTPAAGIASCLPSEEVGGVRRVVCTTSVLAAGTGAGTVTVALMTTAGASGLYTVAAIATSNAADPNSADDEASVDLPTCGDDSADLPELCDGTDPGSQSCINSGFDVGTIGCNATCDAPDTSPCGYSGDLAAGASVTPNPVAQGGSATITCSATNGGPSTVNGTLTCLFDDGFTHTATNPGAGVTGCTGPTPVGDMQQILCDINALAPPGSVDLDVEVDVPVTGTGVLTASASLAATAPDADPNAGNNTSATQNVAVCGDGVLHAPETCDGADTGAATCVTEGFDGGVLGCLAGCAAFDTGPCLTNNPPTLDAISDPAAVLEDAAEQTVNLTGIGTGGETQALQVSASSDNPGLIPDPAVTYTSPDATGSLAYTPVADQSGSAVITVTVTDPGLDDDFGTPADNKTTQQMFTVVVSPVNDPPTLNSIGNQNVDEDDADLIILLGGITAGGGETQPLAVSAVSDNPTLTPTVDVTYTTPANNGTLTVGLLANASGVATITVTVTDGGLDGDLNTLGDNGTFERMFDVTVAAQNDPPTLDAIADPAAVFEDTPSVMVNLSGIGAGGGETQPLAVTASTGNNTLTFAPIVTYTSPNGTGSIEVPIKANKDGSAVITVTVTDGGLDANLGTTGDNGETQRTFTVTVDAINDPPTISAIGNPAPVLEDPGPQPIGLLGISAGGGEIQPISVTATSDNLAVVPNPDIVYSTPNATGTLTWEPVADQFGSATITVTVTDGGLDNDLGTPGDNGVVTEDFMVIVNPVNDPPTINAVADPAPMLRDAGPRAQPLTGISAGGGESQPLSVSASTDNPTLFPFLNVSYASPNATATLGYQPAAGQTGSALITLTVTDGGLDTNLATSGDNGVTTIDFTVTVNDPTDLVISVDDDVAGASVGDSVVYGVDWLNAGGPATGAVLTTDVPAGSTFDEAGGSPGWSCADNAPAGTTCSYAVGAIAPAGSGSVDFAVTVDATLDAGLDDVALEVTVTSNEPDSAPGDNVDSHATPIDAAPDLNIAKDDLGSTTTPGGSVGYLLDVGNDGTQGATGVSVLEQVPVGTTFDAGGSDVGWSCSDGAAAGSTCEYDIGAMAVGDSALIVFAVQVNPSVPAGFVQVSNTALVGDDGTNGADLTPGDDSDSDTTPVTADPNLALAVDDFGATIAAGGGVTYTLSYANNGNKTMPTAVLTAIVPAEATYNSVATPGWTCAPPGGGPGASCTRSVGDLVAGASGSATFAVTLPATVGAGLDELTLNASIAGGATDADIADNSGSQTTPVNAAPDLALDKSDGGATHEPGETVTYALGYANEGTQGASGVFITEVVPAHTTFNPGASSAGWNCPAGPTAGSTCTLAIGAVAAGASGSRDFALTIANPVPSGVAGLTNTATISDDDANGPELSTSNDSSGDVTPIDAAPDLTVSKTEGGGSAAPGGTITYTLTYDNVGNQDAVGVVLTETVPAGTTFDQAGSSPGWSCADGSAAGTTCSLPIGALGAAAAAAEVDFAVDVIAGLPKGMADTTNTASVADGGADGPDPNPGDNVGMDTTVLDAASDVAVSVDDGGVLGTAGGTITYTVTYQNDGNQQAAGVSVATTVPANTTFVPGSSHFGWSCAANTAGSACTFAVGDLAAGASSNITFVVTVAGALPAGVTEIAVATTIAEDGANGPDPAGNNSDSDTTPLDAAVDVAVAVDDADAVAALGASLVYTISYDNLGTLGATGVTLATTVPANTVFDAANSDGAWSCGDGSAGTPCSLAIGGLPAQGSGGALFAVIPEDPLAANVTELSIGASIADDGGNGSEASLANNIASDTTALDAGPDWLFSKVDGGALAKPGVTLTYTLDYTNVGNQDAGGVVVTETVPANTTFDQGASSPTAWNCPDGSAAGTVCQHTSLGVVPAGGSGSITFAVTIDAAAPQGGIVNTATIADDGVNASGGVVTVGAGSTASVKPCGLDYTFDGGPGEWATDTPGLWQHVVAGVLGGGYWRTGGDAVLPDAPHVGRVSADIAVPTLASGGLAPVLEVVWLLEGEPSPIKDHFAICLNDTSCTRLSPSVVYTTAQNSASNVPPVGAGDLAFNDGVFDHIFVPMNGFAGQTVSVTLLYETNTTDNAFQGLTIQRVQLFSDYDNDDLIDGDGPLCDRCWDFDGDNLGHVASPDLSTCVLPNQSDCKDDDQTLGLDCSEDCANGLDDNNDNSTDCDDAVCAGDPFCAVCSATFTFDTGPGGWTPGGTAVFAHGSSASNGSDVGWETGLNTTVDAASGGGAVKAFLVRDVYVDPAQPEPALEITYTLRGDGLKDTFGVCFDRPTTQCDAGQLANTVFNDVTITAGGQTATAIIPIPDAKKGGDISVVIFYDTQDGLANSNDGLFIAQIEARSDIDADGDAEALDVVCDHCIDVDHDDYGDPLHPFNEASFCPKAADDCDDGNPAINPGKDDIGAACLDGADTDCNGLEDDQEADCSICGDDQITAGETCDDGNTDPNDGCSAACQAEAGALHITEIHFRKLFGNPSEQWIEIFNSSGSPIDLGAIDLQLVNGLAVVRSLSGDCTFLTTRVIEPGGFYVIGFGPSILSDGLPADATCPTDFQLQESGDAIEIRTPSESLDVVSFGAFGCELGGSLCVPDCAGIPSGPDGCGGDCAAPVPSIGRSLMITVPDDATSTSNDAATGWCLAGLDDSYGTSGRHWGSPGSAGSCGEFRCDGVDDDCNGATDEINARVTDGDGDLVCDEQDCAPGEIKCAADCSDSDDDQIADCADGCIDPDGDGYGVSFPANGAVCANAGSDCAEGEPSVNPGGTESTANGDSCLDFFDNDCDGAANCQDSDCQDHPNCEAETCELATPIACGEVVQVAPLLNDFEGNGCSGDGADAVLRFTAPADANVAFHVLNKGTKQYAATVLEGSCANDDCTNAVSAYNTGCASGGIETVSVTNGTDYFIVLDAIGPCAEGPGRDVTVRAICSEICAGAGDPNEGVDEDADGLTDCKDDDCVLSPACADADFDEDGFTNSDEDTCGADPFVFGSQPSADDVLDIEPDGLLNCVDPDDDNDGTDDAVELLQCLNPLAKNVFTTKPGADPECLLPNIDQDCTGIVDTFEDSCGGAESACADNEDNDSDGKTDCADPDCVTTIFCALLDFDMDGVSNGFEIYCNTKPKDPTNFPTVAQAADPDNDNIPNCADQDDDNDGFDDAVELVCGSSPLDPLSVPLNSDDDEQCDAADNDDDNDGFLDFYEQFCGSDTLNPASTPHDGIHDQDGDEKCDAEDGDDDGDTWDDNIEALCGTDPNVTASNPTLLGLDGDGDHECDELDNDDDNDTWTDQEEALCGTDPKDPQSVPVDTNGDHKCDDVDQDADSDNWSNAEEAQCGTNPQNSADNPTANGADQDDDHLCDPVDDDDDGDGWADALEQQCETSKDDPQSVPKDTDDDGKCNFLDDDDDGDGWADALELACGTDPLDVLDVPVDTSGNGQCDAIDPEADPDMDGWNTATEIFCGTDPLSGASTPGDIDGDDLCDGRDSDKDGDGWENAKEIACGTDPASDQSVPVDTDNDTICNTQDSDDDSDGVPDADELLCGTDPLDFANKPLEIDLQDTDMDGEVNCNDLDDDGDLVSDVNEALLKSNPLVKDSDGDGLDDGVEDANQDGLTQADETSPVNKDSDADGLQDGLEAASCYPLPDGCERTLGWDPDTDDDGVLDGAEDKNASGNTEPGETNPVVADSDGDGTNDGQELLCDSDPLDPESGPLDYDQNGICDGSEADGDGDGVANGVELFCGFDPASNNSTPSFDDLADTDQDGDINCVDGDDDGDGVADGPEIECGNDPRDAADTPAADAVADYDQDGRLNCSDPDDDDDGLSDVAETGAGTNPQDRDSDDDGLSDGEETALQTNPTNPDTDGDGVQDGTELGETQGTQDTDPAIFQPDMDPNTKTDVFNADTDGDGLSDGTEDTNKNGRVDPGEGNPLDARDGLTDTDGDGLIDRDELLIYHTDPNKKDTDDDRLDDKLEVQVHFTDPNDADTDDGGVIDGIEVENGTNPKLAEDDFSTADVTGDNVFGCELRATPLGGLSLLMLTLLGLWLLRRRKGALGKLLVAVAALGTVGLGAGDASAQAVGNVNIQGFFPAGGAYRIWSVEHSTVAPAWRPWVSVLFHGENDSLKVKAGAHEETLVSSQQYAEFNLGIGIADYLQFELALPLAIAMESDPNTTAIVPVSGGGLADMVARLRGRFINNLLGGFGLAATLGVTIPTGDGDRFRGDPGVGILFNLVADWRNEYVVVALNLGTRIRTEEAKFLTATFGNELTYGLGVEVTPAIDRITLSTEFFGRTPLDSPFGDSDSTSLEMMFGPKVKIIPEVEVQAAASIGLVQGRGTPDFRFVAGVQYAMRSKDSDGDGIDDDDDRCPYTPEDLDGFADIDGCPEDDNDGDGIPDAMDTCPNKAEDFNDFEDTDGCPDKTETEVKDGDGDGIPDSVDRCPEEQETFNGFQDGDGCKDVSPTGPAVNTGDPECALVISDIVFFDVGKYVLNADGKLLLDKVAERVKARDYIIELSVNGHADDQGSPVKNLALSNRRAREAVQYLVARGVKRGQMAARGFGEANPLVDADTPTARRKNRRVDFTVKFGGKCAR